MTKEFARPTEQQRTDPPYAAGERAALEAWLDFQRQTLVWKCDGLTPEQLVIHSVEPSSMSLLGLVRHMADVERWWFRQFLGQQDIPSLYDDDAEWDGATRDGADDAFAALREEIEQARATAASYQLDDTTRSRRGDYDIDLRWIYLHMIEEYARHNGHADLLRERIDGVIGD